MEVLNSNAINYILEDNTSNYDRAKEVKEFEEIKAGVKGLVDSGVTKIPRFFVDSWENVEKSLTKTNDISLQVPMIDFEGRRTKVIDEIRKASKECRFF